MEVLYALPVHTGTGTQIFQKVENSSGHLTFATHTMTGWTFLDRFLKCPEQQYK
jgi:hypothetical protein